MDDSALLCPSLIIGRTRSRVDPSTSSHRPPPPIQGDRALTVMLSRAMCLRYLPRAMHATYVAKDKGALWEE